MHETLEAEHLHEHIFGPIRRDYLPLRVTDTLGEAMARLRVQRLHEKVVYFYVNDEDRRGRFPSSLVHNAALLLQPGRLDARISHGSGKDRR
jgi:hypothetical protein